MRDILAVRAYLFNYLNEKPDIKYIVADRILAQSYLLLNGSIRDELNIILIKENNFSAEYGSNTLTVYRVARPEEVLSYDLTKLNTNWEVITRGNVSYVNGAGYKLVSGLNDSALWFTFNSSILARDSSVGFNVSLLSSPNCSLLMNVYCDVNGDGVWSGYDVDKASSVKVDVEGDSSVQSVFASISKPLYPIVRVGLTLLPSNESERIITLYRLSISQY